MRFKFETWFAKDYILVAKTNNIFIHAISHIETAIFGEAHFPYRYALAS
jgi:hypothetical protein